MPNIDALLTLRQTAQRLHDILQSDPDLRLAAYLASMLVLALAEHIADAAGDEAPRRTARRH
ncbi:hypothetical protein [Ancylobacter sp. IITR112]|uniref:hypothetical protein n=1 Tax=Ancylobacter sp. IITR112 TaxID=3138073 RepID=UPI00352BB131